MSRSRQTCAISRQRIHRACAHRPCRPDHDERHVAIGTVRVELPFELRHVHAEVIAGRNPANRRRPEAGEIGRLLDPGVRLGGCIHQEPWTRSVMTVATDVPPGTRGACGEEADEVRHVAAAHEQSPAAGRIANELGDPANRLCLDLGRRRRQRPRADIGVQRGREEVTEHPDRRRRRGDVSEELRVRVEERVVEQLLRRRRQERCGVRSLGRQAPVQPQCFPHRGRRSPAASPARVESLQVTMRSDRRARVPES